MDKSNLFHRNFFAMNTRFEVVSYGKDAEIFTRIFDSIEDTVNQLERVISCYDELSEVYRINQAQPVNFYDISVELLDIIRQADLYKNKTNGCFDYCFDRQFVYGKTSLSKSVTKPKVELDPYNNCFRFTKTGFALDFGAIGKGLALERVARILLEEGISNCFISFGESSILTRGKHPHGPHWPFSLANSGEIKFQLNDGAVSTSDTRQPDGNLHIIDPRNNQKISTPKLVSVKSPSPVETEVLSTALLVAKEPEVKNILNNFFNYQIIIVNYEGNQKIRKIYD